MHIPNMLDVHAAVQRQGQCLTPTASSPSSMNNLTQVSHSQATNIARQSSPFLPMISNTRLNRMWGCHSPLNPSSWEWQRILCRSPVGVYSAELSCSESCCHMRITIPKVSWKLGNQRFECSCPSLAEQLVSVFCLDGFNDSWSSKIAYLQAWKQPCLEATTWMPPSSGGLAYLSKFRSLTYHYNRSCKMWQQLLCWPPQLIVSKHRVALCLAMLSTVMEKTATPTLLLLMFNVVLVTVCTHAHVQPSMCRAGVQSPSPVSL